MKSFTDNTGRAWLVNVNVGTIKRVRALCGVDLANIISIESGQKPKIELLERLASDAIEFATSALLDEIIDFFPEAKRKVFRRILDATRRFETKTKEALSTLLADPKLDARIDAALEKLTTSSSNLPESAE